MPKLKTHKGAQRRFKISSTGKVMHRKGHISHLRTRKAKRAQTRLDKLMVASKPFQKIGRLLLPYGTT